MRHVSQQSCSCLRYSSKQRSTGPEKIGPTCGEGDCPKRGDSTSRDRERLGCFADLGLLPHGRGSRGRLLRQCPCNLSRCSSPAPSAVRQLRSMTVNSSIAIVVSS